LACHDEEENVPVGSRMQTVQPKPVESMTEPAKSVMWTNATDIKMLDKMGDQSKIKGFKDIGDPVSGYSYRLNIPYPKFRNPETSTIGNILRADMNTMLYRCSYTV
jgi:hypothetical protein